MKVLVLNCGSSSIKYKLFDMTSGEVMAQGGIEKIGLPGAFLKLTDKDGKKVVLEKEMPGHKEGIEFILSILTDKTYGCIKEYNEIDAVGHRVVHGGEKFASSVKIDRDVINKVIECSDLAPLHNPANLKGIDAMEALIPGIPQVAVFDTAFHQTMPAKAYMYGLPYEMYTKYGVRRYGFHGTSHRYVSRRACEILGVPYEEQKIITAHVGNGGSIAAVDHGKCVDTSMGLTPVEGLLMGTRCGDVDAGALSFIMEKEGLDGHGLSDLINKKSGVAGLVGGARVFGPKPRDYWFKLNKKVKTLARKSALSYKAQANAIVIVEDFTFEAPKTKDFVAMVNNLKIADKKLLLVLPEANKNVYLSARNIERANVAIASALNTYKVLDAETLVVTESSLKAIENILS